MDLEDKVKEYIRTQMKDRGIISLPISKIAVDVESSTATVWRALQRLEDRKIIKVIRPRHKTQPNAIYYLGEEDELQGTIEELIYSTENLLVVLNELKGKVGDKDDMIFDLRKKLGELNR